MTVWQKHWGIILFGLIAVIVVTGALVAFNITGPVGIEGRFHAATGSITEETGGTEAGIAGFFLEGNALLYILILIGLIGVCLVAYRQYRI